jgi:nitrogenase molybdenum-cofactor synthesis protein NifE
MVKMAFQVPQIAVVFVIPMGCGRHGGVATMKEGLKGSLSYLPIAEVDIVTGGHLAKTEEALTELIEEEAPRGIMLFTTCIDDLLGSDYDALMEQLEARFAVPIRRGKMNPLMSLSKKPPEMMIYNSMHDFLKKDVQEKKLYNVVGTPCPIDPESELHAVMALAGLKPLQHVACFSTLDEYQSMARAEGNLLIALPGKRAAENMEKKLGQPYVSVFSVFRLEGIRANYEAMESFFDCELDFKSYEDELVLFLESCRDRLRGKTAVIGTTLQAAAFELARFLTEIGMEVKYITAGIVKPFERIHLPWLEENAQQIRVIPSVEPSLAHVTEPIDVVDYGFGLDTPAYFKIGRLIEVSEDENLFGYAGTRKLIEKILYAEEYTKTIKEHVYSQNLVV